jgi:hypothetical protein
VEGPVVGDFNGLEHPLSLPPETEMEDFDLVEGLT